MENENELLKLFDDLLDEIKNNKDYKKLIKITKELSNNTEVKSLIEEIKTLQKEIVSIEAVSQDANQDLDKLDKLTKQLFDIPIYNKYYYLNKAVQLEIDILTNTIEKELNKACEVEDD